MRSLLLALLSLNLTLPALASLDAMPLVRRAAAEHARAARGVISVITRTDVAIRSPIYNLDSHSDAYVVAEDGDAVRIFLDALRQGGKDVSPEARRAEEEKQNQRLKAGERSQALPYDPRHLDEYRYAVEGTEGELTLIRFSSPVKDRAHGHGTMAVAPRGEVHRLYWVPNDFGAMVTEGVMSYERGEALPGVFGHLRMHADYRGSYGPVQGSMTLDQTFGPYRRHASLAAALGRRGS